MTWHIATTNPTEPGWYACKLRLGGRPVVLYWGSMSVDWRAGAAKQDVVAWLGPL